MSVFDIETPEQFFHSICTRFGHYRRPVSDGGRTTEDLLYVIMGLTHLREWIAPTEKDGKTFRPTCSKEAKKFHAAIFADANFTILRQITNGTKHLAVSSTTTAVLGGATVDEWQDFDAILCVDSGPPSGHLINNDPAESVIAPVITIYRSWFDQAQQPQPLPKAE
jgi:hypothetical protein